MDDVEVRIRASYPEFGFFVKVKLTRWYWFYLDATGKGSIVRRWFTTRDEAELAVCRWRLLRSSDGKAEPEA